jgi:hypothetical protein
MHCSKKNQSINLKHGYSYGEFRMILSSTYVFASMTGMTENLDECRSHPTGYEPANIVSKVLVPINQEK